MCSRSLNSGPAVNSMLGAAGGTGGFLHHRHDAVHVADVGGDAESQHRGDVVLTQTAPHSCAFCWSSRAECNEASEKTDAKHPSRNVTKDRDAAARVAMGSYAQAAHGDTVGRYAIPLRIAILTAPLIEGEEPWHREFWRSLMACMEITAIGKAKRHSSTLGGSPAIQTREVPRCPDASADLGEGRDGELPACRRAVQCRHRGAIRCRRPGQF